jgi:hypothetical protein
MLNNKPILVTGSHRSGSTWVGKMLATSDLISYIHEPFNLECSPGICRANFSHWFTYITEKNEDRYYKVFQDTFSFNYSLQNAFTSLNTPKDIGRLIRDYTIFLTSRTLQLRPLVKDPIALFSCEWLASRFNMDVIILIRHPAAFVNSIKLKNWNFPFSDLLDQPLLIRDHLFPFESQIRESAEQRKEIVDQAILLWNLFHYMIIKYQNKYPNWLFLRHEDISLEPEKYFQHIFENVNIEFSEKVRRAVKASSSPTNSVNTSQNIHFVKRNSKLNIVNWKKQLSESEIQKIRQETSDIACKFYFDKDW